jgi:hypothetical protein
MRIKNLYPLTTFLQHQSYDESYSAFICFDHDHAPHGKKLDTVYFPYFIHQGTQLCHAPCPMPQLKLKSLWLHHHLRCQQPPCSAHNKQRVSPSIVISRERLLDLPRPTTLLIKFFVCVIQTQMTIACSISSFVAPQL